MARKKRSIRMSDDEWEQVSRAAEKEGLSISEYVRLRLVHGYNFSSSSPSVSVDFSSLEKKMEEISLQLDKIESILYSLPDRILATTANTQTQKMIGSMLQYYSKNPELLLAFSSVEEFEKNVRFPHWRGYVLDFLSYLKKAGVVSVTRRGRLVWFEEKLLEVLEKW